MLDLEHKVVETEKSEDSSLIFLAKGKQKPKTEDKKKAKPKVKKAKV